MGRPGKKITRKTILLTNRMKELELKERSSKSLLANVLDIDDDFRHVGINSSQTAIGSKCVYIRFIYLFNPFKCYILVCIFLFVCFAHSKISTIHFVCSIMALSVWQARFYARCRHACGGDQLKV